MKARVLLVHNRYLQRGGEDTVFETERDLLARMGHEVETLVADNAEAEGEPAWKAAAGAVWSFAAQRRLEGVIRRFRPDVAHFHNTFLRISPAAYWTCRREKVPVVQTLHNFRLACVNALFYRDGRPCEDCLGRRVALPGILHRCYHGSLAHSALVASVSAAHRALGTWTGKVDAYIALSQFIRDKFVAHGLPAGRVHVKGNFVDPDPGAGDHAGGYALFVGRLSEEKGVGTLARAWSLGAPMPLKIAGGGPMLEALRAAPPPGTEILGPVDRARVIALMKDAALLIFPSEWYENFPVTLVEALATGLPVAASSLGAMAELAPEPVGFPFRAGSPESLLEAVRAAAAAPEARASKGREARRIFLERHSAEGSYARLLEIYAAAGREAR